MEQPPFQFTLRRMLLATSLAAMSMGAWVVYFNHIHNLINYSDRVRYAIVALGVIGTLGPFLAFFTIAGRRLAHAQLYLLLFAIIFVVIPILVGLIPFL
ncbi:MAG: hypothetical protein K8T25_23305 [Planctomycetia bacterium]|nr:hypothetical protein [Planctomycetia bacterium]